MQDDHPSLAIHKCLFSVFAVILHKKMMRN